MRRFVRGFALIEVMIVVAITVLLGGVAFPAVRDALVRARFSGVILVAGKVRTDRNAFYPENGRSPAAAAERTPFEITSADATQRLAAWRSTGLAPVI
jgi:prepilin-type N-terminal cleavage/methylation domain-containing protein